MLHNKIHISIQYKKSLKEEGWGIQERKIKEEGKKGHGPSVSIGFGAQYLQMPKPTAAQVPYTVGPLYPCTQPAVHMEGHGNSNLGVQVHFERRKSTYILFILYQKKNKNKNFLNSNGLLFLEFLCV